MRFGGEIQRKSFYITIFPTSFIATRLCCMKNALHVPVNAVCHRHRQDATLSAGIARKQQIQSDVHLSCNEDIDDA